MSDEDSGSGPHESPIDRVRLDPRLRTRDDSGVMAIAIGTLAWAIAWIVLTVTTTGIDPMWTSVSAAGVAIGVLALIFLMWRRSRKSRSSGGSAT